MGPSYHHRTLPSSPNWFGCSLARRCLMGEEINCRITRRGEAESGWCPTIISIFNHILISIFFCLYFSPYSYCYFHHQFCLNSLSLCPISQSQLASFRNTDSQHFSQMYLTNERNTDLTNERNTDSQHFEHLRHPPEEIVPILVVPYFLTLVHFNLYISF